MYFYSMDNRNRFRARPKPAATLFRPPALGPDGVLHAEVIRMRYVNPDNGYAIAVLRLDSGVEVVASGALAQLNAGQRIEATGTFEKHPEFGWQFRVSQFHSAPPQNREGIRRFLASALRGVGPKTAEMIVEHFGDETLEVLENFPRRLREVPGIGPKKLQEIIADWRASAGERENLISLQGLGISPAYCARLIKRYGDKSFEIIQANPYRLADEIDGIGFLKADAIARELGFAENSPDRLAAATVFAMNNAITAGNVCLPDSNLVAATASLLGPISSESSAIGLQTALTRRLLFRDGDFIYTPALLAAEIELPRLIARLASVRDFAGQRLRPRAAAKIRLAGEQLDAINAVSRRPLTIITGGPGVGKTTVVGEIVARALAAKQKIALAAPTGRAAKRLSESTGVSAQTLHRLLAFDPATGHFTHDRSNPLNCRIVIVDESSMLDLPLALALFRAIRPGTSVVLVGDADQLPSVGPGNVFSDLIASGHFDVTRLVHVFRQAENSRIILNAHRVNRGLTPERPSPGEPESDFYWIDRDDPGQILQTVEMLTAERIPAHFGFDPIEEIQVLTPMNRGGCGAVALNTALAARLNGGDRPGFPNGDRIFKVGDKVMQTSNNYDKLVFNGDMGRIESIFTGAKRFTVRFDGTRRVDYTFAEADQLVHSYAITVHKSQGSEFPAVVLVLSTQHYMMLQRNLLYTGMTRARKLLVIVGSARAVAMATRNTRYEVRFSQLAKRLANPFPDHGNTT